MLDEVVCWCYECDSKIFGDSMTDWFYGTDTDGNDVTICVECYGGN